MKSHLLEGLVRHRRTRPFVYALEHGVYYVALDLDELDDVDRASRLLGRNRRRILVLRDDDHLVPPARDIRASFLEHLQAQGEEPTDWQVTLVTSLRVLGYVFNPASFFICRDRTGALRVVVVEVHNTHGERHLYTLRPRGDAPDFAASMSKEFYVSPFIEARGGYTVRVREEASRLRITINQEQPEGLLLHTSLDLVRWPLTNRNLIRMLIRHPFVTHKTIGMIHWHALRLWLRGARFHRHRVVPR